MSFTTIDFMPAFLIVSSEQSGCALRHHHMTTDNVPALLTHCNGPRAWLSSGVTGFSTTTVRLSSRR